MRVRVFGGLEVDDGASLDLGGAKRRGLLGVLLAARGRPVPVDRIVDQVWPEGAPAQATVTVQAHVAKLRRVLEPGRERRADPQVLVTRPGGYALVVDDDAVDVRRFEALLAAAAADPGRAEALEAQALALWTGPPYAGLDAVPVLAAEARRLEQVRLAALEDGWTRRVRRGEGAAALGELAALATAHPTRERLWALLATAQYAAGRQAEALETLRLVRHQLADSLGIDPGPALAAVERGVLRQDLTVETVLGAPGAAPVPAPAPVPPRAAAGGAAPADPGAMAGRADVLALVPDLVAAARRGEGRVVLVTGEPGIGKTRVAAGVADLAAGAGLHRAWGGWDQDDNPPLHGWTTALPGLTPPDLADRDSASAAFALADRAVAELGRAPGSCLVLDDVQWADPDSLRLLTRVAALAGERPVLLVVLCREPVAAPSPALTAALAALARLDPVRVPLRGLDDDGVRALVRERRGADVSAQVAAALRRRSAGNPFFLTELVRLLAAEGGLDDVDHPAWGSVPEGIRDVVRHRVAELPGAAAEVLTLAAVVGLAVDLDVLERAWPGDPAAVGDAVGAAVAAGLLVDDAAGLRFAHALVRDTLTAAPGVADRRRWHARVAAALEQVHVGHLDASAAVLAEHYRAAGSAHARSAWTHARRAARVASDRGAQADAARLLADAVASQALDPVATAEETEQVAVALGTALRRAGQVADAWAPLARAAASALDRGDGVAAAQALLPVTEHVIWSWRTTPVTDVEGVRLWGRVLAALPPARPDLRARCAAALAVETIHEPPGRRGEALVDEAVDLARRGGDEAVLADVLQVASTALRSPDLVPRRVPVSDELVELCARRGDERGLAAALAKRAATSSALGRPEAAWADLERALPLALAHHMAPVLMVVRLGLTTLAQAAGDVARAEEELAAAESIQSTLTMAGNGIGIALRASAAHAAGGLGDLAELLGRETPRHPIRRVLREWHALALLEDGRVEECRRLLGTWAEQPTLPLDYMWVSVTALRGSVWARLGDPDAVADLRRELTPWADRTADGAMAAFFLGSVHQTLGELALAAGDGQAARDHARVALADHRAHGWRPWEARSADLLARAGG